MISVDPYTYAEGKCNNGTNVAGKHFALRKVWQLVQGV